MKEEWLLRGAVVPVDVETTAALVAEIKRLIDVVGGMALAQPEQEPDYWLGYGLQAHTEKPFEGATPIYTSPPQRKPLTDEQRKDLMNKAWNKWLGGEDDNHLFAWHFSFEVEAAHGIKETK